MNHAPAQVNDDFVSAKLRARVRGYSRADTGSLLDNFEWQFGSPLRALDQKAKQRFGFPFKATRENATINLI